MLLVNQRKMAMQKLLDFGFNHIDIWRSEPMTLAQVGATNGEERAEPHMRESLLMTT